MLVASLHAGGGCDKEMSLMSLSYPSLLSRLDGCSCILYFF